MRGSLSKSELVKLLQKDGFTKEEINYAVNSTWGNKGWARIDGEWYYYDDKGILQTEWKKLNNKWYYLEYYGSMQRGWTHVDGRWYYMNSDGSMNTTRGWVKRGNHWYYQLSSGAMGTGWRQIGGKWYYMNHEAFMQRGWTQVQGIWYYMNANGAMHTGWLKDGENWYYFNSIGAMQRGWKKINNTWYYMKNDGSMKKDWLKLGDKWYYLSESGAMQIGRINIDGTSYYFRRDGSLSEQEGESGGKYDTIEVPKNNPVKGIEDMLPEEAQVIAWDIQHVEYAYPMILSDGGKIETIIARDLGNVKSVIWITVYGHDKYGLPYSIDVTPRGSIFISDSSSIASHSLEQIKYTGRHFGVAHGWNGIEFDQGF